jgi:predicted RNA-binding Zn ribbon-like protein
MVFVPLVAGRPRGQQDQRGTNIHVIGRNAVDRTIQVKHSHVNTYFEWYILPKRSTPDGWDVGGTWWEAAMTEPMTDSTSGEHDPSAGFLFVGESLALDFVNTAIVVRGQPRDLLAAPADLAAWLDAAATIDSASGSATNGHALVVDEVILSRAKAFRASLRGLFTAVIAGGSIAAVDLDALNHVLRTGFLTVDVDGNGQLLQAWRSHDRGADGLLLPIARSAMTLLTESDLARLHRCANERCVLLFHDTTKSGTRRWCSTGCMNRARSSRRYRERRAALRPDTQDS